MYKYVLFLFVFTSACSSVSNTDNATILFHQTEHNFGAIPMDKKTEYRFECSNPGKANLVIYNVETSCGCTVAEWTKSPIQQNGKGVITVQYNPSFSGAFMKEVKVYYNGKGSPAILHIRGEVRSADK